MAKRVAAEDPTILYFGRDPCKSTFRKVQSVFTTVKNAALDTNQARWDADPTCELINVAPSPNFPMPPELQSAGLLATQGLVIKTDANFFQYLDKTTLGMLNVYSR
jgi:torulene dioxygenase